jgi:arylsulfatase A-like enzyme
MQPARFAHHPAPRSSATSNAPLREGKGYLYEGGIREPCIVCWPGIVSPGSVSDEPICGIDFYSTFLEAGGIHPQPGQIIDGLSLMPVLRGGGHLQRNALFWHYPHYSDQGGKPGSAIRRGDWKLIRFDEDKHLELYNLAADIGEKNDLAEKDPARAHEMENVLDGWLKSVDAQMTAPNPDYGRSTRTTQRQANPRAPRADD